ncbi:hypothetical protein [Methanococcoides sp.]|jgi:hypothetical protein|uniref:hypothetical protein n=1 Tax=Methanococcoides sp. TaxID=1966350 RepID=UPI00272DFFAB|nr:hypothetical protein [Methanococcoides sp.]
MNTFRKLLVILLICAALTAVGCTNNSEETHTSDVLSPTSTQGVRPDGSTYVEYFVPKPYTSNMAAWMMDYSKENRITSREELHLFNFDDGRQYEMYIPNAGAKSQGNLLRGSWTNEPDESFTPTAITEEQFQDRMEKLLANDQKAYFKFDTNDQYGKQLYVHTSSMSDDCFQAEVLKNYIDYNSDRDKYFVIFSNQLATENTYTITGVLYEPHKYSLVISDTLVGEVTETTFGEVVQDATYTSIVKAIESCSYTNHPGKYSFV